MHTYTLDTDVDTKITKFDSMGDMIDLIQSPSRFTDSQRAACSHEPGGITLVNQACDRAMYGWPGGLALLQKEMVKIKRNIPGRRETRKTVYSETVGTSLVIDRYISGHPKMLRRRIKDVAYDDAKIITLQYNYAVSSGISQTAYQKAARIVVLIEELERTGHQCELIIINGNYSYVTRRNQHHFITYAKRAGERINMESIAYLLCHTDMDRRLAFAMMDHWDNEEMKRMSTSASGMPGATSFYVPDLEHTIKVDAQSTTDGGSYATANPDEWLLKQLEAYGIKFDNRGED